MKALVIAIAIAAGLVGVAIYRERKDDIKAWFKSKFTKEDNKTEYQKHLERGGKDYRHINK